MCRSLQVLTTLAKKNLPTQQNPQHLKKIYANNACPLRPRKAAMWGEFVTTYLPGSAATVLLSDRWFIVKSNLVGEVIVLFDVRLLGERVTCRFLKCLLHVDCVLGTCFEEWDFALVLAPDLQLLGSNLMKNAIVFRTRLMTTCYKQYIIDKIVNEVQWTRWSIGMEHIG